HTNRRHTVAGPELGTPRGKHGQPAFSTPRFIHFEKLGTPPTSVPIDLANVRHTTNPSPRKSGDPDDFGRPIIPKDPASLGSHAEVRSGTPAWSSRNSGFSVEDEGGTPSRRSVATAVNSPAAPSEMPARMSMGPKEQEWETIKPFPTPKSRRSPDKKKVGTPSASPRKKGAAARTSVKQAQNEGGILVAIFKILVSLTIMSYIGAYTVLWDRVGYRNVGAEPPKLNLVENPRLDDLLSNLIPLTRQCPKNATCFGKAVISCNGRDMVLKHHPLVNVVAPVFGAENVQFLVPFGLADPFCARDNEKLRKEAKKENQIEKLMGYLDNITRVWIGRAQCGQKDPNPAADHDEAVYSRSRANPHKVLGMPIAAGKRELRAIIKTRLSEDKFNDLWSELLTRISEPSKDPHRIDSPLSTVFDDEGRHRLLVSTNPPIMSMVCSIKQSFSSWLKLRWKEILGSGLGMVGIVILYLRSRTAANDAKVVAAIVADVLQSLYDEYQNYLVDHAKHPIPGFSVAQLRDHFIPVAVPGTLVGTMLLSHDNYVKSLDALGRRRYTVPETSTRDRLWKAVARIVLRNATVRETTMEFHNEMHTVWQWIGGTALNPGTPGRTPVRKATAIRSIFSNGDAAGAGVGAVHQIDDRGSSVESEREDVPHVAPSVKYPIL
ncbi:inner nuclear membrane protein enriched at telomere/subtelomere region, partial [Irineochytrium annulatum]